MIDFIKSFENDDSPWNWPIGQETSMKFEKNGTAIIFNMMHVESIKYHKDEQ